MLFVCTLNLIPNFGTLVAIIPAILLAIGRAEELNSMNQVALGGIFNNHMSLIGGVLLVFLVVQIIQDFILVPKIMGKRTGLRPATILFSVFVWGKLLGFLGVILAIPLTCLTKVYFARFILKDDPESTKTEEQ
ncbi:AI-2E family transporter [candidate division KSB1 bacterium]|nr:AI-2E family transporter [candidate division KSB1 bacterium]